MASTPPEARAGLKIAVDGPAASGKGTAARALAKALGYTYVDTGTLYRTLALLALERSIDLDDEDAILSLAHDFSPDMSWEGDEIRVTVGNRDVTALIRTESMGSAASKIAAHQGVRLALLGSQRRMAAGGGVVMDGRDIGSVVLPDADLKVYLDASTESRAHRRELEMRKVGITRSIAEIRKDMESRDRMDRERKVAPLIRLPEAVYIDSTDLTPEQVVQAIIVEARARGA